MTESSTLKSAYKEDTQNQKWLSKVTTQYEVQNHRQEQNFTKEYRDGFTRRLKRPILINASIKNSSGKWVGSHEQKAARFVDHLESTFQSHE